MSAEVRHIKTWGTDLEVGQAAFVNPDKLFEETQLEALIEKMASNGHDSPFMHGGATFFLSLPLVLWCQLDRSRVGFGLNQFSRRYRTSNPRVALPDWREKGDSRETASDGRSLPYSPLVDAAFGDAIDKCVEAYNLALDKGAAPEQARFILPQGTFTTVYWTGTMLAWARMCKLRLAPDTQLETQQYARAISNQLEGDWPISWYHLVPASQKSDPRQKQIALTSY